MHRKIGLLVVAAVVGASTATAAASTGTTADTTGRQAVVHTADVMKAAATVDHGVVMQRIASAAQVSGTATEGVSAAAVVNDTRQVRFAAVSVAGLSGTARQTASRWNALVANGEVGTAQRQLANDAAVVAHALTTMRPTSAAAICCPVQCALDTADTVLLVAFFVEVDAVFIPQDCGANVGCLENNENAAIGAQEFFTVILLEADVNCFLFG